MAEVLQAKCEFCGFVDDDAKAGLLRQTGRMDYGPSPKVRATLLCEPCRKATGAMVKAFQEQLKALNPVAS